MEDQFKTELASQSKLATLYKVIDYLLYVLLKATLIVKMYEFFSISYSKTEGYVMSLFWLIH